MTRFFQSRRRKRLLAAAVAAPLLAGAGFALAQGTGDAPPPAAPMPGAADTAAPAPAPGGAAPAPAPTPSPAMAQADVPPPPPPRDDRGPRHGPRHGRDHGPSRGGPEHADLDEAAMQQALEAAGYTAVALVDTGPRHGEFSATDAGGRIWLVHVDADNEIRERSPFVAPMEEEAAIRAAESLGYTSVGGFEARRDHVELEAKNGEDRLVIVELNADGSLKKERYPR